MLSHLLQLSSQSCCKPTQAGVARWLFGRGRYSVSFVSCHVNGGSGSSPFPPTPTLGGSLWKLAAWLNSAKAMAGFPAPRLLLLLGALLIPGEFGCHVPGSSIAQAAGSRHCCLSPCPSFHDFILSPLPVAGCCPYPSSVLVLLPRLSGDQLLFVLTSACSTNVIFPYAELPHGETINWQPAGSHLQGRRTWVRVRGCCVEPAGKAGGRL